MYNCLFSDMRNKLVVGCMFLSCTVVAPILWHLWIYAGSANANFYFAITLTFSTAEVMFDLLLIQLEKHHIFKYSSIILPRTLCLTVPTYAEV